MSSITFGLILLSLILKGLSLKYLLNMSLCWASVILDSAGEYMSLSVVMLLVNRYFT